MFKSTNLVVILNSQFQVNEEDPLTGPAWFLVSEFDSLPAFPVSDL